MPNFWEYSPRTRKKAAGKAERKAGMNKHVRQVENEYSRHEIRTRLFWTLEDLHAALMRRDVEAARAEMRLIGNVVDLSRATQFLDDGLIGAAEAEVASFMFKKVG